MADVDLTAELDRLSAIEQAATEGEWKRRTVNGSGGWAAGSNPFTIERVVADARPGGIGIFDSGDDAEFIVTSRTAMPRLLAAVEAVLELADKLDRVNSRLSHARVYKDCARLTREVISREITGKGENDAPH